MPAILEKPKVSTNASSKTEKMKLLFRVFLGFRRPYGHISFFNDCNVYHHLGKIFNKLPDEIHYSVYTLMSGSGDGFMQEYLSLEDASWAVTKASLFAKTAGCRCLIYQGVYFYIKEVQK